MLIRFVCFFKSELYHLVFFLGGGGGGRGLFFLQQLKLDIYKDFSESIYLFNHKKSFLQLLIAPIRLKISLVYIL